MGVTKHFYAFYYGYCSIRVEVGVVSKSWFFYQSRILDTAKCVLVLGLALLARIDQERVGQHSLLLR